MYTYHTGLTKVMFNKHRLDIVGPFLHPWLLRDKQHSAIGQYPSFYVFIFLKIILFLLKCICFWLCWVLVACEISSSCGERGVTF